MLEVYAPLSPGEALVIDFFAVHLAEHRSLLAAIHLLAVPLSSSIFAFDISSVNSSLRGSNEAGAEE